MENSIVVPKKYLSVESPYDPAIPPLGIYPQELKAGTKTDICRLMFIKLFGNLRVEATWVSISGWTNNQHVVCTYDELLSSFEKEGNPVKYFIMDESWGHHAKWNMLFTKRQILCVWFHVRRVVQFIRSKSRKVVAWAQGSGVQGGGRGPGENRTCRQKVGRDFHFLKVGRIQADTCMEL